MLHKCKIKKAGHHTFEIITILNMTPIVLKSGLYGTKTAIFASVACSFKTAVIAKV